MVVAKQKKSGGKIPVTLQMPPLASELIDRAREFHKLDGKKKWAVTTAAVLSLLEKPADERMFYISEALAADSGEEAFRELFGRSESGDLRRAWQERQRRKAARFATDDVRHSQSGAK